MTVTDHKVAQLPTAFVEIFKKHLMVTNLGHHGHMTWYILNIPDDVPSQNVMVTFFWCTLNVLNMHQFSTVLVLRPRPCNVLAMYQVSASPLAPSVMSD